VLAIWTWRRFERAVVVSSRFLTAAAVLGSLAGSVLMFYVGLANIWEAFRDGLPLGGGSDHEGSLGTAAVIGVIEALDRFLIGIVLLYFAYGVYSLFIHPEQGPEEAEQAVALPVWLRVRQIGQLKQVVAEVIIVVLLVLFLRIALQAFDGTTDVFEGRRIATLLLLPVATLLLAAALRLVQLHPKQRAARPARRFREDGSHDRDAED